MASSLDTEPGFDTGEQPETAPWRTWLVLGDKRGDNGQVEVIAEALGWTCERKRLQMREPYVVGKPKVAATLHHIDSDRSDRLEPPWPDLIVTIGRRPSMVALWIREQSGGRAKIVLVGKPSGRLDLYDLIVAGAEAQLPPLPNVMGITLPLMRIDEAAVAAAKEAWAERFAPLPRPLIGVLVGGPTGPFAYGRSVVESLLRLAADIARETGGTPYFTTSRRTPPEAVETLAARLPESARLFAWSPDAADNPYLALLGHADGFVVTGDSISMMVEVAKLHKPLAIFPLPAGRLGALDQARRSTIRWLFAPSEEGFAGQFRNWVMTLAFRLGLIGQTRDFRAFHRLLIDRGLAVPLGRGFPQPRGQVDDDLPRVVARIRALMTEA
jgi:mitochondrial fission protein ELM1